MTRNEVHWLDHHRPACNTKSQGPVTTKIDKVTCLACKDSASYNHRVATLQVPPSGLPIAHMTREDIVKGLERLAGTVELHGNDAPLRAAIAYMTPPDSLPTDVKQAMFDGVKLANEALAARIANLREKRDALRRAAEAVEPIDGEDPRDGLVIVERHRLDALRVAVEACKEDDR